MIFPEHYQGHLRTTNKYFDETNLPKNIPSAKTLNLTHVRGYGH